jgi:hypothetical protein
VNSCTVVLPTRFAGDSPEQATATIRVEWWEDLVPDMNTNSWDTVVQTLKNAVAVGFEASDGDRRGFSIDQFGKLEVW